MTLRRKAFWIIAGGVALLAIGYWLLAIEPAFAQIDTGFDQFNPGLGVEDPRIIIARIIRILLGFLGVLALGLIIYAGFRWMLAGGREEETKRAQQILVNAAIGLVIILAAYAITQFVLNTLLDATGASQTSSDVFSGGGGPPGGTPFGSGFSLQSITPSGAVPIRNVVVQIAFSSSVNATTTENNILVRPVGSSTDVEGAIRVTGPVVRFTPSAPCPAPNADRGCFDEDTAYEVTVGGGLRGSNGALVNCGFAGCTETFVTGSIVDVTPPNIVITYPETGDSVSTSPDIPVTMTVDDDAGVGLVEALVDEVLVGTDAPSSTVTSMTAIINWVASGLLSQSSHVIDAVATDIAGQSGDASNVTVIARPEHCFDSVQNFGETGIDCGGDATSADYCGACAGSSCTSSAECASGPCVAGLCVELPQIVSFAPNNGASGSFVSIMGENLGGNVGTVTFLGDPTDASDDIEGALACAGGWGSSQVIVAVPITGGFPMPPGPIELTTAAGLSDRTNDTNGPALPDFTFNETLRPGLCNVSPTQGGIGATIRVTGSNLGTDAAGQVFFDSTDASMTSNWSATGLDVVVPSTTIGEKNVVMRSSTVESNPLRFEVTDADLPAPSISYISPASAPRGGYITVFGDNFGASQGTVRFVDSVSGNEAIGDVSFPPSCTVSPWHNDSITVKVPQTYTTPIGVPVALGAHNVRVVRADLRESDVVGFSVVSGTSGPGICGITPVSGPTGAVVNIYGEYFGSVTDGVTFYNGAPATASRWEPTLITAPVPSNAVTGPLTVSVGGNPSNEVNFEVASCDPTVANACSTGNRCCPNTLACTPLTIDCSAPIPSTNMLFEWVTGPIPVVPRVIRQCDAVNVPNRIVSPSPWDGRSGGTTVCVNAKVTAAFTTNITNINAGTVQVQQCTGADPEIPCAQVAAPISGSFAVMADRFEFTPDVLLPPSTSYRVTLTTGITAAGPSGEPMSAPFVYTFRTGSSPLPCAVESVMVAPGQRTLTEEGDGVINVDGDEGDALLSASGLGSDACVLLSLVGQTIQWSTTNNVGSPASPSVDVLPRASLLERIASAANETVGNAVNVIATLVQQGINGRAFVTVDFTDPEVQNFWPNCDTACVNAQIGAEFNVAMDPTTLTASSVHLEECPSELCEVGLVDLPIALPPLIEDGTEQIITPLVPLAPNTFYRVSINGTVRSSSGVALVNLNRGNTFSWTFRVSPDGALCAVDHVETAPSNARLQAIGQRQGFAVTPFGPPDSCSEGGQRLNGADYGWSWTSSNTTTAFLMSGGILDLGPAPGCNGQCVLSGSQANISVCGNGVVEYGEQCDGGNATPGDGCSNTCVWEGTAACVFDSDPLTPEPTNCCGNSAPEAFEECDDGNSVADDGCSATCTNEGSAAVGSVCGNGSLAYDASIGGEECDDGNTASGDGCSFQCIWEGSNSNSPAVCGNGVIEIGEACDGGNATPGDGCSAVCRFEGQSACSLTAVATGGCCGNGAIESLEECDDGAAISGDGCSNRCILEGSSIDYAVASFCGDGAVGAGELATCEGLGGDGRVDPAQYAEVSANIASQEPASNGLYTTLINATEDVSNEDDAATLSVSCSCQASAECPTGGVAYACAETSGCCAPRPALPTFEPVGSGVCRNAQVRVTFVEVMDVVSFTEPDITLNDNTVVEGEPNLALRISGVATEAACDAIENATFISSSAAAINVAFLPHFLDRLVAPFLSVLRPRDAQAIADGCYMPVSFVAVDAGDHTEVILEYSAALEPNQPYTIVVVGDPLPIDGNETGVLTESGAGFNAIEITSSFITGNEICDLDTLPIADETGDGFYATANTPHTFTATATSLLPSGPVEIVPLPGVYDWSIAWTVPEGSEILSVTGDTTGSVEAISSQDTSGLEYVTAVATITADNLIAPSTVGREVTGSLRARVFICEVPWPDSAATPNSFEAPLSDTLGNNDGLTELGLWSNFAMAYCRAETLPEDDSIVGVPTAYAQEAPLPTFQVVQPSTPPPGVLKEFILRHPTAPEAIGIRVIDNPTFLPVSAWYEMQGFTGVPSPTRVDGYRAIQDGRTLYVGAVNVNATGAFQPTIYTIAYSEGASAETVDVYNQLVTNFQFLAGDAAPYAVGNARVCLEADGSVASNPNGGFYTCTSNAECITDMADPLATCDATQDKVRRDVARFEDVRRIEQALTDYASTRRHCLVTNNLVCLTDANCPGTETCQPDVPLLDAGSFIRGWSTSAWPSWTTELGAALVTELPTDPLNVFATCPASDGFDQETCWDGDDGLFMCPANSHVYRYQRSGISNFTLAVDMETNASEGQWSAVPTAIATNGTLIFGSMQSVAGSPVIPTTCNGTLFGNSGVCGDGIVGSSELCEIGQTSVETCTSDFNGDSVIDPVNETGVRITTCVSTEPNACSAFTSDASGDGAPDSACVQLSCGNGVIEGRCINGPTPGVACLSNTVCGAGGFCSFNVADGAETCDDGELNGQYGFCSTQCNYNASLTLMCGNGVVEGPEICDDGALNGVFDEQGNNCAWDCSGPGPRCGDGLANGDDQCDLETATWAGALCSISREPCVADSECPLFSSGEICGDGNTSTYDPTIDVCVAQGFCVGGTYADQGCDTTTGALLSNAANNCSLGGGTCTLFDTFRSRSCALLTCDWNTWSSCQQQGSCGNGIPEAGELCDDGNAINTDGCTNICQPNVCGDGFINPNVESCDLGTANVVEGDETPCTPGYGGSCNYCTTSCIYQAFSGGYCGDDVVQSAGGEICDGGAATYYANVPSGYLGGICTSIGAVDPANAAATCQYVGVCDGGSNSGDVCSPVLSAFLADGNASIPDCMATDDGGECQPTLCSAGCGNSCPFNYQSVYALAQPYHSDTGLPIAGSGFSDTVELYSYQTNGICVNNAFAGDPCQVDAHCNEPNESSGTCVFENAPDYARVQFPTCRVGSQLLADVEYNVTYPELDVVFVVDASASMNQTLPNGQTRWAAMKEALANATDILYEYPTLLRVGVVSFGGLGVDELTGTSPNFSFPGGYNEEQSTRDCVNEPYWSASAGDYLWPEDWNEIGESVLPSDTRADSAACIEVAPSLDETVVEGAITGLLNPAGNSTEGSATPTPVGLKRAKEVLDQFPVTNKKIVILFTDGTPSCYHQDSSIDVNAWDPACTPVADALHEFAEDIKADGIDLYMADFAPDPELPTTANGDRREGRMFQVFSSDCPVGWNTLDPNSPFSSTTYTNGTRWYSRYAACTQTRAFSYYGDTVDAFNQMFESIVSNILNARIYVGDDAATTASSLLNEGNQVEIQLPSDFECPVPGDGGVDIELDFVGLGTVTLSNFQFLYCAP